MQEFSFETDLRQDFAIYFTNQYKVGDKVSVYYDIKNPENFLVDTKQSSEKANQKSSSSKIQNIGSMRCVSIPVSLFIQNKLIESAEAR